MEPFHAYLQGDESTRSSYGLYGSYLIIFANRETADEWWRMISTPPSPYAGTVERFSPQLYFQNDTDRYNVLAFYTQTAKLPDARQLYKKMLIIDISRATFHPMRITDHISGGWYSIRSKTDPWSYWYLRTKGACLVCGDANCDAVHVSIDYRTNFRVQVRNQTNTSEAAGDFIMIGKDEISITGPKGYILHIDNAGDLKATKGYKGETDLLFGDLKKRFISRLHLYTRLSRQDTIVIIRGDIDCSIPCLYGQEKVSGPCVL